MRIETGPHRPPDELVPRGDRTTGVLAAVTFASILVGTNAVTPLLPLYRRFLRFDPLMLSTAYAVYLVTAVAMLTLAARRRLDAIALTLLTAAIAATLTADLLQATMSPLGIVLGRMCLGVAVGIATGSVTSLVVAGFGARGRAISSTGNLAGAVAGTAFAQAMVSALGPAAMHWIFVMHGGLCGVLLAALLSRRGSHAGHLMVSTHPDQEASVWATLRANPVNAAIGCLAWIALCCALALLPSLFTELGMAEVETFGAVTLLVSTAAAQIVGPRFARLIPRASGLPTLFVGSGLIVGGCVLDIPLAALAGLVPLGVGLGTSYRLALLVLAQRAAPHRQGELSSVFAALTYGTAAIATLLCGAVSNLAGLRPTILVAFAMIGLCALLLACRAPGLGDAVPA